MQKPARQAASFSSFLRKQPNQARAQPAAAAAPANADGHAAADAGPALGQKPVAVLYGTEYGFSKEIAEKLVGKLTECGEFWYFSHPYVDSQGLLFWWPV